MLNLHANDLSDRELEILYFVAMGASNKEIAQKLFISSNTVKVHIRNIFAKIGATSRTEAAMYAVRIGLVGAAPASVPSEDTLIQSNGYQLASSNDTGSLIASSSKLVQLLKRPMIILTGMVVIALILLVFVVLRHNNNPTSALISPTSTPRIQWFELPGLPTPRQGLAVINYNNQIYAIGGETTAGVSNVVERFNPLANSWTALSPKLTSVTEIGAAAIGGLIYVPGGKLSTGKPTNVTEVFDPRSNLWSARENLPKALSAYAIAVFEGRIYLFGGWDGNQVVNDAYVYDNHNDTWSPIAPMPTARSFAGAVEVDGSIYVIGGWDGNKALTTDEVYRPGMSEEGSPWTQAPSLPFGQYGMGVANLSNIIFVIGGVQSDHQLTSIALIPDETDWVKIDNPLKNGWAFLSATTLGTRIYALGGKTDAGLFNEMWSYQAIYTISLPIVR